MGSLQATRSEILLQATDLPKYAALIKRSVEIVDPRTVVFTGCGDSYSAALIAESLSSGQATAVDPYEALLLPHLLLNRNLCLISVSGRTTVNVELTRAARAKGKKTTAVTANRDSPLARSADRIVELSYVPGSLLTPGTLSYTMSLLACFRLLGLETDLSSVHEMLKEAESWAGRVDLPSHGNTFYVGSNHAYGLALYGAAKTYEILGFKAQYERTEQFSHMELFSLTDQDLVILIPADKHDHRSFRLLDSLISNGLQAVVLIPDHSEATARAVSVAMHLQLLAYSNAQKLGVAEVSFVSKRRELDISDSLIY